MDGSPLEDDKLFSYEGDLRLESIIVADWYGSEVVSSSVLIPKEFALSPAYPNPFNPTTTLSFALPLDSEVFVTIYNLQGRQIATLVNTTMEAGYHTVTWDANSYSSGVYFVHMIAGEYVNTQKLMLVK
jgi:flagellar hook assembly protein FlgD